MTEQEKSRLAQLDIAIIRMENADTQGPEGRDKLYAWKRERAAILAGRERTSA